MTPTFTVACVSSNASYKSSNNSFAFSTVACLQSDLSKTNTISLVRFLSLPERIKSTIVSSFSSNGVAVLSFSVLKSYLFFS